MVSLTMAGAGMEMEGMPVVTGSPGGRVGRHHPTEAGRRQTGVARRRTGTGHHLIAEEDKC